jgi:hypothetical protein
MFGKDLLNVLQATGNSLGGILLILSFVIVPYLLPFIGIFLVRSKTKLFQRIDGGLFFLATIIILIVWLYPFANGSSQYGWEAKLPFTEILKGYGVIAIPLGVSYLGMFFVLDKRLWIKALGALGILIGIGGYVLIMVGRVCSGT